MIVEVIAVGTELLLGQIINTNAASLGAKLAEDGFDVHHQVTVGDNIDRIVHSIATACHRADAVILTGGIGPTQDDLTRDAICVLIGVGIERDETHADVIRGWLATRGVTADTALRMADYPSGADPLPNTKGVALGIATRHDDALIFAVPGVPAEMEAMIDDEVRPRLRAASGEQAILSSRVLHTWGFGESQIAELLNDLYESANPSIAFLISGPEVRIRITAKGPAEKDVDTMIRRVEDEIRTRLGSAVFGSDDVTVDAIVVEQLSSRGATLAIVESSTAGLVTARLASTPGFVGGAVVTTEAIDDVEARAIELADGCTTSADVVIAISEFVSEGQGNNMAAQRVGVAIRTKNALCVRTLSMLGDTERAQQFAVPGALHVLRQTLATV
ncbi:molybdopterin-binding protein [uncultured Ilumatobacter sp.]|jgi:nicotinamide-nucleotide amidase|uniref:molybdopterin-binding protein n=1 Tax=uncultured Ilumatobacter sp. TaxID=879968 RepID=UPI00374E6C3C